MPGLTGKEPTARRECGDLHGVVHLSEEGSS
jgi:hypothetical protein